MKTAGIYFSICAISLIQGLQFSVSPVLGDIQASFPEVDVSLVQMLVTAPGLLSMGVALLSRWLVLRIPKKKLLLFAAVLSGCTGLAPLLAHSFPLLFACRLLYGVALGIATTLNVAVVAEFFQGEARVKAMGVQSASIGGGMLLITTLAGFLGRAGVQLSYGVNGLGFLAALVLLVCLPDTGCSGGGQGTSLRLNGQVLRIDLSVLLEFFFLITFTTNISMHLSGPLEGNSAVSGLLTGVFSAAQIAIGMVLGTVTRITKGFTLSAAMLCFSAGAVLLVCFPSSVPALCLGAVLCGFSQGIYIPTGATDVANAVTPEATAFASATYTCAMNLGQLLSPTVLNAAAAALLGSVTTGNVYRLAAGGMALAALGTWLWKRRC